MGCSIPACGRCTHPTSKAQHYRHAAYWQEQTKFISCSALNLLHIVMDTTCSCSTATSA